METQNMNNTSNDTLSENMAELRGYANFDPSPYNRAVASSSIEYAEALVAIGKTVQAANETTETIVELQG